MWNLKTFDATSVARLSCSVATFQPIKRHISDKKVICFVFCFVFIVRTASLKRVFSSVVKIKKMKIVFIPVMPMFSFTELDSMNSKLYDCVSVMYRYTETFYVRFSL